jgi:propionate CoA-transferase
LADGIELIELAPDADLERDVLGRMEFRPKLAADLKRMDARLFRPEPIGLARDLASRPRPPRNPRLTAAALPRAAE